MEKSVHYPACILPHVPKIFHFSVPRKNSPVLQEKRFLFSAKPVLLPSKSSKASDSKMSYRESDSLFFPSILQLQYWMDIAMSEPIAFHVFLLLIAFDWFLSSFI